LEKLFKEGMTWENHGEWHIDHIIPISKAKTAEEIYKLNHYTNLQPLWKRENLCKGSKIII
jgi:5-methylcytosine-specific restriction endonuclease McrA